MKVVFCENGKPKVIESDLDLKALQQLIGGYIEIVQLRFYEANRKLQDVVLVVDEEGRLKNKPINFIIGINTPIHGAVVFAKTTPHGKIIGLSEKEISGVYQYLGGKNYFEGLI